jgi:hypothetical protein
MSDEFWLSRLKADDWLTANDQQPTTKSQRPKANDQKPTTKSQRPTANDQRPKANSH